MKKVLVYVEGQTEETFIRDLLAPHLNPRGVYPIPVLARTKRTPAGRTFKGGIVSYRQVKGDIQRLLGDRSAALITTIPQAPGVGRLIADVGLARPEEVNEGKETYPSARIQRHVPQYRKPLHGPLIAQRIGLETMRARCPHFHQWLERLESLGEVTG